MRNLVSFVQPLFVFAETFAFIVFAIQIFHYKNFEMSLTRRIIDISIGGANDYTRASSWYFVVVEGLVVVVKLTSSAGCRASSRGRCYTSAGLVRFRIDCWLHAAEHFLETVSEPAGSDKNKRETSVIAICFPSSFKNSLWLIIPSVIDKVYRKPTASVRFWPEIM